jgi:hypothetical protein
MFYVITKETLTATGPRRACVEASDLQLRSWDPIIVLMFETKPDGKEHAGWRFYRGTRIPMGDDLGGYEYNGPGGCVLTIFND